MNIPASPNPLPHDELPLPYRIAVQAILAEPEPKVDPAHWITSSSTKRGVTRLSRRHWMTRVCGVSLAGAAAVVLAVSWIAIQPVDAWAQVVDAVRKHPWVRLRAAAPDKSAQIEIWLSPTKRIGAGHYPGSTFFLELDQYKLQRFDQKDRTIYVSEPRVGDLDHFAALDAVLQSFANRQELRQSKAEELKLLGQSNKRGGVGDDRWTDYVLDYEDDRRSPPRFRRVFRVPEGASLPTKMTEDWTFDGQPGSRSYEIDYPADGPASLFALNVPQDAKVVDTRSGEELNLLLAAYTKQQKTTFDPYTSTMLTTVDNWKSISDAYRVRLDAAGHTAEVVDAEQLLKFQMERFQAKGAVVPDDVDRIQWWKAEVNKLAFNNFGQRDTFHAGQTFCPDLVGYPGLGFPNEGVRATLNPKPFVGPADSVMVTVEEARSGVTLGRYWLAPNRGLLCVRSELPDNATGWIATVIVDAAEKSPKGRWYATQIRHGRVERSGDDLRSDMGVAPVSTSVYRYLVEFD